MAWDTEKGDYEKRVVTGEAELSAQQRATPRFHTNAPDDNVLKQEQRYFNGRLVTAEEDHNTVQKETEERIWNKALGWALAEMLQYLGPTHKAVEAVNNLKHGKPLL